MRRVFDKEIIRAVSGSWGRFLAIAGIVALGCGFYAGLRMTGPDMRIAADDFYDGTSLYDIRMLSGAGFTDEMVDRIAQVDGVESVMPSRSADAMAALDSEQYAVRISTLDVQAAQASTTDGVRVASSDDGYLNRLVLSEGSWPSKAGECVLSADRVMGTPVQIGDTVQVLYGSQDLDGVLNERTYTVVGLAHSSSYVSSVTMGSTTLGTGAIQQFLYVTDDNFDAGYPYTETYVKVAGAQDDFSGSASYKSTVDAVTQRLEGISGDLADQRLDEMKSDAQSQLDSKTVDYNQQKSDAVSQLDAAKKQLDDTAAQLDAAQASVDDGQARVDAGYAQLAEARRSSQQQLQGGYDQLSSTQAQLDAAQAQLDAQQPTVDAWPATRTGLVEQAGQAQADLSQSQRDLADVKAEIAALNPSDPDYEAKKQALEAQASGLEMRIASDAAGIENLNAGIASGDSQMQAFYQGQASVQAGRNQLADGWASYEGQKAAAESQLDASQAQLDASAADIATARDQLAQGRMQYSDGLAAYEQQSADATARLDQGAQSLADAQTSIDSLAAPSMYVLDRTKNYGVASFQADSERVDNIAAVFPFIFFLVAALVALTTMTRMVDEDRVIIGTYKALGYGTARITWKYLFYAGAASLSGAVIGIAVLSQILPLIICKAYAIIYNVPQQPLPLPIDAPLALLSLGMGVGITLFATAAAVWATLREQPAALMLPRAPKAGKRILLERITPVWRKLSFSWKVTCRNLFRYKKRLLMTVIGIAGCTALLLTGLGLHDAIWDIIDKQFNDIVHYNVIVKLQDDASEDDVGAATGLLEETGNAYDLTRAQDENMQVESGSHGAMSVEVVVPQDADAFTSLLSMRDRASGTPLTFDDHSVVLTEKLASTLGVRVGDSFTLHDQDEIGNAIGDGYAFTVTGIMENYVGNWMYIGRDAYTGATGTTLAFASMYGICTDDAGQRETLSEGLHGISGVETVTYNDETIDSYRKMLSSVDMIVVVLVAAAASLAFIVLYNLTNINITERRREIASLKVLGFTVREVDAYIYREIIILTLAGAALGLVLGVFLEGFVVVTTEVDYVMFGRSIHMLSFVGAFALTAFFSAVVMIAMRRKLGGIDMVESLKSID
jgi:putative ABC transport system permease protein